MTVKSKYIQLARLAGLLHDIGHGPFSHAFDRAIYSRIYGIRDGGHDLHRLKMVKSPQLCHLIRKCGIEPDELIAIWNSETTEYKSAIPNQQNWYDIIRAVVQGPLGADRMDFTTRDATFCGVLHLGTISCSRIIDNTSIRPVEESKSRIHLRLHYHYKCLSDIIQALTGRYYMYESVYLHKTSGAADILINQLLENSANYLDLVNQTDDLDKFQNLNDYTLIGAIMAYSGTDPQMALAKKITEDLLHRRLPKIIPEAEIRVRDVSSVFSPSSPFDLDKYLDKWANCLNISPTRLAVCRTRTISGIESCKFDRHHIYFWKPETGQSITCQEALDSIQYQLPVEPFYLVRVYKLRDNEDNDDETNE